MVNFSHIDSGPAANISSRKYSQNLSVAPQSADNPQYSPYNYVINNPIRLIDPDGNDWFENEITGAVYYNSDIGKGQEGTGAMKGKGWVHMGQNDMFSDGTPMSTDASILYKNSKLTSDGVKTTPLSDGSQIPLNESSQIKGYNIEATFKGKNAELFMNGLGYEKKPILANVHTYEKKWSISEPFGPVWQSDSWESIESVSASRYIPKGVEGRYNIEGYYKRTKQTSNIKTCSYSRETWETRRYDYNHPPAHKPGNLEKLLFEVLKNIHYIK